MEKIVLKTWPEWADRHPVVYVLVNLLSIALLVASLVLAFVFAVGLILHMLEVHSIYNRLLPEWRWWHYLMALY